MWINVFHLECVKHDYCMDQSLLYFKSKIKASTYKKRSSVVLSPTAWYITLILCKLQTFMTHLGFICLFKKKKKTHFQSITTVVHAVSFCHQLCSPHINHFHLLCQWLFLSEQNSSRRVTCHCLLPPSKILNGAYWLGLAWLPLWITPLVRVLKQCSDVTDRRCCTTL